MASWILLLLPTLRLVVLTLSVSATLSTTIFQPILNHTFTVLVVRVVPVVLVKPSFSYVVVKNACYVISSVQHVKPSKKWRYLPLTQLTKRVKRGSRVGLFMHYPANR